MSNSDPPTAAFEQVSSIPAEAPTLIEGLPGHGLVAAIAVDLITEQLGLQHCGNIVADEFPPVVTFEDGLVHDLVRVYADDDPPVMTLESDLALPQRAHEPLSRCVLEELATEFDQAIFIAGAPAESEAQLGTVSGVATTDSVKADLLEAGVPIADDLGLVGGVTGALVKQCYHADVPAALLIVNAHPFLPDPDAAKSVIETALEPLVDFDVDTTKLTKQAEEIRRRMEQVAEQYQQMIAEGDDVPQRTAASGMYQ